MKTEIPVDTHLGVGPYPDVHGHGPVTILNPGDPEEGMILAVCLDCGYAAEDIRRLAHEDCARSENAINQTWRELIEADGFPE